MTALTQTSAARSEAIGPVPQRTAPMVKFSESGEPRPREVQGDHSRAVPRKNMVAVNKSLQYSWWRAQRTFFLPQVVEGSALTPATNIVYCPHLRLKLHNELLYPHIADVMEGRQGPAHPSPQRFELIRKEVLERLNESVDRFIDVSFTNTGNYRGAFGTAMSLVHLVVGFVCVLAYGLWKAPPYLHILSFYCYWCASWGTLCTVHGVCQSVLSLHMWTRSYVMARRFQICCCEIGRAHV